MPTLIDHGIDRDRSSIDWRQLIFFDTDYKTLKKKLKKVGRLVEFDLPTDLKVTSELAHGEYVPLTEAIYCPWLDKDDYIHFNVGYNKRTNKCCITTFRPGDKDENKLFIKIANKIPCFYMDGTFGPNEMVFLAPKNFEDSVKTEYEIIEKNGEHHIVGQMVSGRYFVDNTLLNADYVKNCVNMPEEFKKEWIRKHTTQKLDNKTYITHQSERFVERIKNYSRWTED